MTDESKDAAAAISLVALLLVTPIIVTFLWRSSTACDPHSALPWFVCATEKATFGEG